LARNSQDFWCKEEEFNDSNTLLTKSVLPFVQNTLFMRTLQNYTQQIKSKMTEILLSQKASKAYIQAIGNTLENRAMTTCSH